jgi:ribosome-associated translation inhibitor RaiA
MSKHQSLDLLARHLNRQLRRHTTRLHR